MITEIRLRDILAAGRRLRASDIHLTSGGAPRFRVDGKLCVIDDEIIEAAELHDMLRLMVAAGTMRRFRRTGELDAAYNAGAAGRIRLHAYRAQAGTVLALRLLSDTIPDATQLELPPALLERLAKTKGLLLFAGATGSGKTTAMTACLEYLNQRCDQHIITIEDPIEYLVPSYRAQVSQRQVGRDVRSFDAGIYGALRSDPDVIAIGELRDQAAILAALRAAETGHLVMATVHSDGAVGAIDRIIDAFGNDTAVVRGQLAAVIEAILAVQLLPRRNGGRIFGTELLVGSDAVRALIREGKTHQLPNAIATGRAMGMHTMASRLAELIGRGEIAA